MKQFLVLAMALLVFCSLGSAQTRYVVSPGKDARVLPKGKSALEVARQAGWTNETNVTVSGGGCPTSVTTPWRGSGTNFGFNDGDVSLMRILAPVTGVIESLYFEALLTSTVDSSVSVRIFESAFTPGNPEPAGTSWLGWYEYPSDPNGVGTAPFADIPGVTSWIVGDSALSPWGFDPNGAEIWGFGGYPTTWHSNTVTGIAMIDLGVEPNVNQGDYFNVNFAFPSQLVSDAQRREQVGEAEAIDPFDFMKFYYRGRTPGVTFGWWAREFNMNTWAVIRAVGNLPPIITSLTTLGHTISTGPRPVMVSAFDCNATDPADTGIVASTLYYRVDGGAYSSVAMTGGLPTWTGSIPGLSSGLVEYYVLLEDNLGLTTESVHEVYRVVDLNRTGYMTDYNATFSWIDISGTGTAIPNAAYFAADGVTNNDDDGTAGPFDLGADFNIFGSTGRYAWVGVNGAIALSMTPDDTIHVNSNGSYTNWEMPNAAMPSNFISAFWNDLYLGGGLGTVYYQDLGTMFVIQYEGIGNFNDPNDQSTFEIILDHTNADHIVYFQYEDVGGFGLETTAMSGLQGETSSLPWLLVCNGGAPEETAPSNGKAITMTNVGTTGVRPVGGDIPTEFALFANYPNPFNPTTNIKYSIPATSRVVMKIFDALGREVATVVNGDQTAGTYVATFDASNLANGMYFYRLQAGNFSETKKMILLK